MRESIFIDQIYRANHCPVSFDQVYQSYENIQILDIILSHSDIIRQVVP
jgi:hypothetical protein